MGKVYIYNPSQKPPTAVGVPQLDNSGSILASAIAGSTNLLANASNQAAAYRQHQALSAANQSLAILGQSIRQAQARQADNDKKAIALNNENQVITHGTNLEIEMDNAYAKLQKDFDGNPNGIVAAWEDQAPKLIQDYRDRNQLGLNPAVDNDVLRIGNSKYTSTHKSLNDWVIDKNADNAANDLDYTAKNIKQQGQGDIGSLYKAYNQADRLYAAAFNRHGEAYAKWFVQDIKEGALENHLDSQLRDNPSYVKTFIEQGNANGIMNGKKQTEYLNHSDSYQEAIFRRQEFIAKKEALATNFQVDDWESALAVSRDQQGNFNPRVTADVRREAQKQLAIEQAKPEYERRHEVMKVLTGFINKTAQAQKSDVQHKEHMAALARSTLAQERAAAAAGRAAIAAQHSAITWKNYLAGQERAEARRDAIAVMSSPDNMNLLIKADAAHEIATRGEKLQSASVELQNIQRARELINKANAKGLYTLPGSPPSQYVNMQKSLTARLQRVSKVVDENWAKANTKPDEWYNPASYGLSPQEKYYNTLAKGPPQELVNTFKANNNKPRMVDLKATWTYALNANVEAYKSKYPKSALATDIGNEAQAQKELNHIIQLTTDQLRKDGQVND